MKSFFREVLVETKISLLHMISTINAQIWIRRWLMPRFGYPNLCTIHTLLYLCWCSCHGPCWSIYRRGSLLILTREQGTRGRTRVVFELTADRGHVDRSPPRLRGLPRRASLPACDDGRAMDGTGRTCGLVAFECMLLYAHCRLLPRHCRRRWRQRRCRQGQALTYASMETPHSCGFRQSPPGIWYPALWQNKQMARVPVMLRVRGIVRIIRK